MSAAALIVNVMAAISSGRSTRPSSARKRWMRSSVFPEPAGACTMNDRDGSSARSRCAWSGARTASLIGFPFALADRAEGRFLRDAAEHVLVAVLAGCRPPLGIDARVTLGESAPDRIERHAPSADQAVPIAIELLARRILVDGAQVRGLLGSARDAAELRAARFHDGECHRRHALLHRRRVHRHLGFLRAVSHPVRGLALAGLVIYHRL